MSCEGKQYGNIQQTLFLGCSIVSFSASIGWNEQAAEVTVELVEDTCGSPAGHSKRYWDTTLTEQSWTNADPGFAGKAFDIIGMPCYFRLEDFEFTGLIQSWERSRSQEGIRYIVKLVSPVSVLENTKLIVGEYAGSVIPPSPYLLPPSISPYNIINVFGFAESEGILCEQISQTSPGFYEPGDSGPDGATFGTPAGGFGGSLLNSNGMPWYMIRNLTNVLINSILIPGEAYNFSPYGRILGKSYSLAVAGSPWTNGFGLLDKDRTTNAAELGGIVSRHLADYFVDLSELPTVPNYFRFNQSEISILEAISRVCQEAGSDFYIELLPVSQGGNILKFIKIRTISRVGIPAEGVVDSFITAAENNGILKGATSGKEYRNEINSRFVVGGLKQTVYQAYENSDPFGDGDPPSNPQADDMILPFFGTSGDGSMLVPYLDSSGFWEFEAPSDSIETSLEFATFSGLPVTINENELRAAETLEMWATHIHEHDTDTNKALTSIYNLITFDSEEALYHEQIRWQLDNLKRPIIVDPDTGETTFLGAPNFEAQAKHFQVLTNRALALTDPVNNSIREDTNKIYQWVAQYARDYYGRKFAVRVPYTCAYVDGESNQVLFSEQPTQDGGWTEVPDVIGIPTSGAEMVFFRNDSNKIETIIAFTGINYIDNISELDPEQYITYNNNLYIRGTVDSEYVFHDPANYLIPRAIVEIPIEMHTGLAFNPATIHGLIEWALNPANRENFPAQDFAQSAIEEAYAHVANKGIAAIYHKRPMVPNGVAFGIRSNIDTYGPWVSLGPAGGIAVDKDDGLVPWEYNGYSNLNAAGIALADADVTNMQIGEMGSVSVVGCPDIPLGAELASASLLTGVKLVENRIISSGSAWNGTYATGGAFDISYWYFDYGFYQSGVNGPSITNVSVNVGTEISTQYQFRTYTPKFGRFARLNAERLKEVNQNRMRYVRDLRSYVRDRSESKRKGILSQKAALANTITKIREDKLGAFPSTPHELFVGQTTKWGQNRRLNNISTSSFNELGNEFDINTLHTKAIASYDSIIRPVSLKGSASGLPRMIIPLNAETGSLIGTNNPATIPLSQVDFNPYVNPRNIDPSGLINRRYDFVNLTGVGGISTSGINIGHDIDVVMRNTYTGTYEPGSGAYITGSELPTGGLIMLNFGNSGLFDYQDDYNTFALRGPLLLHSWGYDHANIPIPNYYDDPDTICNQGVYATASSGLSGDPLTGLFMEDWCMRPDTWPVAPVDLRLNRQRGVWEAGGIATMVRGIATSSSNVKTQDFEIDNVTFFQGSDVAVTGTDAKLQVQNTFGWDVVPTLIVYAIRPADGGEYTALQVECP